MLFPYPYSTQFRPFKASIFLLWTGVFWIVCTGAAGRSVGWEPPWRNAAPRISPASCWPKSQVRVRSRHPRSHRGSATHPTAKSTPPSSAKGTRPFPYRGPPGGSTHLGRLRGTDGCRCRRASIDPKEEDDYHGNAAEDERGLDECSDSTDTVVHVPASVLEDE